jgi:hypothetical protein
MGAEVTEPNTTPEAAETATTGEQQQGTETDWKAMARKWEANAKANAAAVEGFTSERERLAAQLADTSRAAEAARLEAMRYRVAIQFGIAKDDAEEFLLGDDEDSLTRTAMRFVERTQASQLPASPRPVGDADLGARPAPMALNGDDIENALRRKLGIA